MKTADREDSISDDEPLAFEDAGRLIVCGVVGRGM
jgi:hypothetical protein